MVKPFPTKRQFVIKGLVYQIDKLSEALIKQDEEISELGKTIRGQEELLLQQEATIRYLEGRAT